MILEKGGDILLVELSPILQNVGKISAAQLADRSDLHFDHIGMLCFLDAVSISS